MRTENKQGVELSAKLEYEKEAENLYYARVQSWEFNDGVFKGEVKRDGLHYPEEGCGWRFETNLAPLQDSYGQGCEVPLLRALHKKYVLDHEHAEEEGFVQLSSEEIDRIIDDSEDEEVTKVGRALPYITAYIVRDEPGKTER